MVGDFDQVPPTARSLFDLEERHREAMLFYFGDDFAVGTSLIVTCISKGWSTTAELISGIATMTPRQLAMELVASTSLEAADREPTRNLVLEALRDRGQLQTVARKVARRHSYARARVEAVLAHPRRTREDLVDLLSACDVSRTRESELTDGMGDRVQRLTAAIETEGRERAILTVTGGWTLRDDQQGLVLVLTAALGTLVIPRLLPDGRILVACGCPRTSTSPLGVVDVVALASALASEQRIAILRHIAREPASGQTLAKALGLTGATVHYHTALLRSLGLIRSVREAHTVLHHLAVDNLKSAVRDLARVILQDEFEPFNS